MALSEVSNRSAAEMLQLLKSYGLEGAVARRSDSAYQPGQRTGMWSKYRINLGQKFVVAGYIPSHLGVDFPRCGLLSRDGPHLCSTGEGRPRPSISARSLRTH